MKQVYTIVYTPQYDKNSPATLEGSVSPSFATKSRNLFTSLLEARKALIARDGKRQPGCRILKLWRFEVLDLLRFGVKNCGWPK